MEFFVLEGRGIFTIGGESAEAGPGARDQESRPRDAPRPRDQERGCLRPDCSVEPEGPWLNRFNLGANDRFGEAEVRDGVRFTGPVSSLVLSGFSIEPEDLFAAE